MIFSSRAVLPTNRLILRENQKPRRHHQRADALAFLSEQTNKLDDAKRYADEALTMARADGNKRDETYPRLVQGRVAAQQHDPAAAEAAFHEVAESKDSPTFLKWEAERSLARLYEDENQIDAAGREYRTALSTFEAARSEVQHENSRLPFLDQRHAHLRRLHSFPREAAEVRRSSAGCRIQPRPHSQRRSGKWSRPQLRFSPIR